MAESLFTEPEDSVNAAVEKAERPHRRRENRFALIGTLAGLAVGVVAAVILAATIDTFASPLGAGVVLGGCLIGFIAGMIPSVRYQPDRK